MKNCPKCNTSLDNAYLFCPQCGADLRIPLCSFCGKELPKDARFCPWCGKAVAEALTNSNDSAPEQLTSEKPEQTETSRTAVFTEAQQEILKNLLGTHGVICTPEKVYQCNEEMRGGVHDPPWTVYYCHCVTPVGSDVFTQKVGSRAPVVRNPWFRKIADQADRCLYYQERDSYFTTIDHTRSDGTVWWSQEVYMSEHISMVVSNPAGIGMDVMIEYKRYDDECC